MCNSEKKLNKKQALALIKSIDSSSAKKSHRPTIEIEKLESIHINGSTSKTTKKIKSSAKLEDIEIEIVKFED